MIKLNNLEVKNFKSLIDTNIDKFGTVNMFYGFNNSGKSNIFKFLELVFRKKNRSTRVKVRLNEDDAVQKTANELLSETTNFWEGYIWDEPFLFTKNDRSKKICFTIKLSLSNNLLPEEKELQKNGFLGDQETVLTLTGSITSIDIETSELHLTEAFLNDKLFYKFQDQLESHFEEVDSDILNEKVATSILMLLNDLILFIDSDRNFSTEILKDGVTVLDIKNFKNALFELNINAEKNDSFKKLVEFLGSFDFSDEAKAKLSHNIKSFPFNQHTDFGFTKFDNEIEIMLANETGRFPMRNFGTGIQQFLYILTKIFKSASRILIVEELELNLSPLYQKELLRFIKLLIPSQIDQFIFSSHSPFFAEKDAAMIDIIHHVRIGLVTDGGTSVDCHDDIASVNDDEGGYYYFTLLYS